MVLGGSDGKWGYSDGRANEKSEEAIRPVNAPACQQDQESGRADDVRQQVQQLQQSRNDRPEGLKNAAKLKFFSGSTS